MEIRDIIHGAISIETAELPIIDSRYFQRLRQIKQLGFAENSYPTATHNRYIHSLGAMEVASQAFRYLFSRRSPSGSDVTRIAVLRSSDYTRLRAVLRLGALLHDVGHGPLSHTTEFAMPSVRELEVPFRGSGKRAENRRATHEDYTLKIVLDSGMTPLIETLGKRHGFTPLHVAALIEPSLAISDDFFVCDLEGERVDFRPVLQQLISSELDCDRMDYLRRDSRYAGVSYGDFDYSWLLANLTPYIHGGKCYLAVSHRALYTFEDFLLSRYHMFLMVYFHYKSVIFDEMLKQYFDTSPGEYQLPADIDEYCKCDDAHLYSRLAESQNPWAARIVERRPYRMLMELHSGIPATKTAAEEQRRLLSKVKRELEDKGIHYVEATSTGELSKYFRKPGDPIYIKYDNRYNAPTYIPLEKCTDLFTKYSEKRSLTRLYVSPEDYKHCRYDGRHEPLRYEEEATPGDDLRLL